LTPVGESVVAAEHEADITSTWWVPLLAGLVTITAGIVVLRVNWTVSGLAIFLGLIFIVRGLVEAITPPLDGGPRGLKLTVGMLEAALGVALLAWPGPGLTVVVTFFGCWLVFGGMVEIVGAIVNRDNPWWWLVLLLGIVMVILGIWALDRPAQTLQLIIALAGIWAIVMGTIETVFAFELRKAHKLAVDVVERKAGAGATTAAL
jgi:uncharacterized membrane protein HdeD (DUF308 family)